MKKQLSIGIQGFDKLRTEDYYYIDKSDFISEWWENGDDVTLITRPRRFGKTLNMDMVRCFFSNHYKDRGDLFEGLSIWKDEKYRKLQGTYPVIFLSFAEVKQPDYETAVQKIKRIIAKLYLKYRELLKGDVLTEYEKKQFQSVTPDMDDVTAQSSLQDLCDYLTRYYNQKVIILLDEYDTPMQEAYMGGYWDEFTSFIRSLFNSTFKTNPYLERAIMTGITRVSKESIFSDLNNLNVVTTTSEQYATCFGFTETEVFQALDDFGLSTEQQMVKQWYDGFIFGSQKDIYNPWSITNFLKHRKLRPYWASTSSNQLVSRLIRTASSRIKEQMEELLLGNEISVTFDEQIVFHQLDQNENAIWSLLMAAGYLKPEQVEYRGELLEPWYYLKITNKETRAMFVGMFKNWFLQKDSSYSQFMQALLQGDTEAMNYFMNRLCLATFSYFDVGQDEPEKFYHGFVLGLMAEQMENYTLKSNRESGFGRYDVMLIPKKENLPAIIMEFKSKSRMYTETLEEALQKALQQIEEKNYDAELLALGIPKDHIRHYGFAFEGKKVLIG
ncbi:MAG: AAA family ATPase [Candidatus Gastranaerophilaceae bacterium]